MCYVDFRMLKLEARTLQNKASEEQEESRRTEPSTGHTRNISLVLLPMQSRSDRLLSDLGCAVCVVFLITPSDGTKHLRQETDVKAKPSIKQTNKQKANHQKKNPKLEKTGITSKCGCHVLHK